MYTFCDSLDYTGLAKEPIWAPDWHWNIVGLDFKFIDMFEFKVILSTEQIHTVSISVDGEYAKFHFPLFGKWVQFHSAYSMNAHGANLLEDLHDSVYSVNKHSFLQCILFKCARFILYIMQIHASSAKINLIILKWNYFHQQFLTLIQMAWGIYDSWNLEQIQFKMVCEVKTSFNLHLFLTKFIIIISR